MEMEFWGAVVPPGTSVRVDVSPSDELLHVSQVALPQDAVRGRTALTIRVASESGDAAEHVLCTLEAGVCDQASLELVVDATFYLRNLGENFLHVTGLRQCDAVDLDGKEEDVERRAADSEDEDLEGVDGDSEEGDSEEEGEELGDADSDTSAEEEDMVFGEDDLPGLGYKEEEVDFGASDEEDSDLDNLEGEEAEGMTFERADTKAKGKGEVGGDKAKAGTKNKNVVPVEASSDDSSEEEEEEEEEGDESDEGEDDDAEEKTEESDDDDDDSEEDDDDDDDDSDDSDSDSGEEEEEEKPAAKTPASVGKRAAPEATPSTPVDAKRPKPDLIATPTTATKKSFDAYADEIHAFLEKFPKTHMAALGGKLKKPRNMMMKVKEFLVTHKHRFKIEGDFVSNV